VSTSVSQPATQPSWKQEVNRRVEAHKSRKGLSVVEQGAPSQGAVSDRAAQAAARVAARFSKAPSYSEMQAAEARAALRAAEAATRAALEAQAAAQVALAHLTCVEEEPAELVEEDLVPEITGNVPQQISELEISQVPVVYSAGSLEIRWEPDMPVRSAAPPAATRANAPVGASHLTDEPIEAVEPALPIYANLIEFPREIVATRRMRPRLMGAESADPYFEQLSIFEVDPSTISTEPAVSASEASLPAPSWSGPEWSDIELDSQATQQQADLQIDPAVGMPAVHLAPLQSRLMAATVDNAFILGLVSAAAAGIAARMQHAPTMKAAEIAAAGALILTGVLYHAFFLLMAMSTPGMKYAGISLCTFDDEQPTHAQMRARLGALLVSLVPVGLGIAWALFDEDHLSWHDRLSRTYLRMH
jgi:uncharacterized RDD family membrane protein YckC